MGQLLLGFRSLIIKAAIFVVMAALLAWALGGTLWPRPHVVDGERITAAGYQYWWQMRVGGNDYDQPRWRLMVRRDERTPRAFSPGGEEPAEPMEFSDFAGPVVSSAGDLVAFAGRDRTGWRLFLLEGRAPIGAAVALEDRLAVELALAEFRDRAVIGAPTDPIDESRISE